MQICSLKDVFDNTSKRIDRIQFIECIRLMNKWNKSTLTKSYHRQTRLDRLQCHQSECFEKSWWHERDMARLSKIAQLHPIHVSMNMDIRISEWPKRSEHTSLTTDFPFDEQIMLIMKLAQYRKENIGSFFYFETTHVDDPKGFIFFDEHRMIRE